MPTPNILIENSMPNTDSDRQPFSRDLRYLSETFEGDTRIPRGEWDVLHSLPGQDLASCAVIITNGQV